VAVPPEPERRGIPPLLQAAVEEAQQCLGLKLGLGGGDTLVQQEELRHEQSLAFRSHLSEAADLRGAELDIEAEPSVGLRAEAEDRRSRWRDHADAVLQWVTGTYQS
jgi:hypothetical protein